MFKINKNLVKQVSLLVVLFCLFITVAVAHPLDLFKVNNNTLDLVQISDVHYDSKVKSSSKRMFEHSESLLKDAVCQINNLAGADVVVFSGDVVNRSDKGDFLKFLNIANTIKIPWFYAPGNHDVGILGGVSKSEILCLLNKNLPCLDKNSLYYSYSPNKNFLILFMDGVIDNKITANAYFPKEELNWMNNQLKSNPDKKIIIVQHFPLVEPFKSSSHKVINDEEYFNIIDKYRNVIAVLSGHYHSSKIIQRKNVLHISTPALVEYPNAFREIKITALKDSTKFDIKWIETNLKDVQQISKSRSKNLTLQEGQASDRNFTITIKNSK